MHLLRRAFNGAAAMSVLACLVGAVLWATAAVKGAIRFDCRGIHWEIRMFKGRLTVDDEPQRDTEFDAWQKGFSLRGMRLQNDMEKSFLALRWYESERKADPASQATVAAKEAYDHAEACADADLQQEMNYTSNGVAATPLYLHAVRPITMMTTTVLLPIVWMAAFTTSRLCSRRSRDGFCARCRYDLRATPERCPECGAVPKNRPITRTAEFP